MIDCQYITFDTLFQKRKFFCVTTPIFDVKKKRFKHFFILYHLKQFQEKNQKKLKRMCTHFKKSREIKRMTTFSNELALVSFVQALFPKEKEVQIIVQQWIRRLHITFGWAHDLGKIVVDYVMFCFLSFHVMKKIYLLLLLVIII
ncbi:hypothetical protein RFI_33146 [Reticulomyxa filosa]|uniref:Uncharacterized protein n=1 Tax=Reticulomyxa filosa TaxID=46433 RepID=X6LU40_RETFI|nr:hypothetical protein RFI_33146 [Reticulomyxa filosa]|eukprot:ETO04250.1 hypothetical protein RFI_33146 [Reticulomyxa filosa]